MCLLDWKLFEPKKKLIETAKPQATKNTSDDDSTDCSEPSSYRFGNTFCGHTRLASQCPTKSGQNNAGAFLSALISISIILMIAQF